MSSLLPNRTSSENPSSDFSRLISSGLLRVTCTLTVSNHTARTTLIEELNETALTGCRRDGHRITLRYRPADAARARQLVCVGAAGD